MVLFSEVVFSWVGLLFFIIQFAQVQNELARLLATQGRNHAVLFTVTMLTTYAGCRVLLETETPQSVVPVFLAIIIINGEFLKRGKYRPVELVLRHLTIHVTCLSLFLFTSIRGMIFLSTVAETVKLDRTLAWYHGFLIFFSSWRWFLMFFVTSLPVLKGLRGLVVMLVKVGVVWVLHEATGKSVAPSPWGVYDEVFLEKNALIYLIMGLITFAIIVDQIVVDQIVEDKIARELFEQIRNCKMGIFGHFARAVLSWVEIRKARRNITPSNSGGCDSEIDAAGETQGSSS